MKIYRYFYICESCGHNYLEQRSEDQSQYVLQCPSCGGNFLEDRTEFVEEAIVTETLVIDEPEAE